MQRSYHGGLASSSPSLFPLSPFSTDLVSVTGAWVWGLMAGWRGLPAMGAVFHLGGWLTTVEAPPGYPRHPSSIWGSWLMWFDQIKLAPLSILPVLGIKLRTGNRSQWGYQMSPVFSSQMLRNAFTSHVASPCYRSPWKHYHYQID